jgi:hypothetical protein
MTHIPVEILGLIKEFSNDGNIDTINKTFVRSVYSDTYFIVTN